MKIYMINPKAAFTSFYSNVKTNFSDIDNEKLLELKKRGEEINKKHYQNPNLKPTKPYRYIRVMELINGNCKTRSIKNEFSTESDAEKLLLFMFSVDPNFNAAIIYATYNSIDKIKLEISNELGLFDPYIIKIEKYVIENLLNIKEKKEIYEEIGKRVFK